MLQLFSKRLLYLQPEVERGATMKDNSPTRGGALLKPPEAAKYLAISERKLWSLKQSREIAHVRSGRLVRYALHDLDRWIEEHKEGGKASEQAPSQEAGKSIHQGGLAP
jgi:excisionase family DNA binding protein